MKKNGTIPTVVAVPDNLSHLRDALAGLIAERDQLIHAVIPNIEADYQLKIGALEYEKFEARGTGHVAPIQTEDHDR